MNRIAKRLTLVIMFSSLHFGVCYGLSLSLITLSPGKGIHFVGVLLMKILGFPGYQILDHLSFIVSTKGLLLVATFNSLLWGLAFLPLALYLKNRFLLGTTDH